MRRHACEIHQARGGAPGRDLEDWPPTERHLKKDCTEPQTFPDVSDAKAGQPLRIVMVGGDNMVLSYLWRLVPYFDRLFPMALHDWTYWSFADLEKPITATVASGVVAVADWVVFCQLTLAPLPPHVQSWIERCLERQSESKTTLGLLTLSKDRSGANPIQTYLQEEASRTGTKFIDVQDCLDGLASVPGEKPPQSPIVKVPYD